MVWFDWNQLKRATSLINDLVSVNQSHYTQPKTSASLQNLAWKDQVLLNRKNTVDILKTTIALKSKTGAEEVLADRRAVQEYDCDAAYVINLDKSVSRWQNTTKELSMHGIKHKRFEATDGYKIKIKNLKTGQELLGIDLKEAHTRTKSDVPYEITCNPGQEPLIEFNHIGDLSAGELGVGCSNYRIWQESVKHKCSEAIIFEDDIVVKSQDFKTKLDKFLKSLPSTYDLGIISHGHEHGAYAYVISLAATEKFIKAPVLIGPIDLFFFGLAKKSSLYHADIEWSLTSIELHRNKEQIIDVISRENEYSVITEMGR